jgi:hypothetical protein
MYGTGIAPKSEINILIYCTYYYKWDRQKKLGETEQKWWNRGAHRASTTSSKVRTTSKKSDQLPDSTAGMYSTVPCDDG